MPYYFLMGSGRQRSILVNNAAMNHNCLALRISIYGKNVSVYGDGAGEDTARLAKEAQDGQSGLVNVQL